MKKIFTLIAVAAMAISTQAQNYYAIQKNDPNVGANQSITDVDGITATFDSESSWKTGGGSSDGGTVDGIEFTKYATTDVNGCAIAFATTKAGSLTIYFGGDVATNKSINMSDGTNKLAGTTLVNKETIESGSKPQKVLAKWADGITYTLSANNTYTFFVGGTKWRFAGFKYEVSEGGSTAFNTVKAAEAAADGAAYNLAGQKVNAGYKGLVIKNGKKVIVK